MHGEGVPRWRLELVVAIEVVVAAKVAAAARRAAALLVHLGDDGRADVLHLLELLLEVVLLGLLVVVEPLVGLLEGLLDGLLVVVRDLVGNALLRIGELVLHRVDVVLELVARLNLLAHLLVLLLELLGLLHHALNLVLREAALVVGDGDLLVLAGALVLGADVEDAVGIDLEGDLDLGDAAGRGRDAAELKLAEEVAVLGHRALALEDLDGDSGLVVLVGGEDLRLLGGDDGVARDELRHHAADGLDAQRERRHVEQQQVLGLLAALAREDAALHRRAVGDGLVGVDALVGLFAVEEILEEGLHLGDARRAADEHDLVDLALLHLRVVHDLLHGREGLLEEVDAELLEARARERLREVDAVVEALDLEAHLVARRERALGALDLAAELLDGALVLAGVGAVLALEDLEQVLDHAVVEVLAAQVCVTRGGDHLEDAVVDGQERHVEGAATEVEDEDVLLARLLVEAIGDGRSGGLVDDAHDVQAGDEARVLGRLPLRVVEVGGDGHDRVLDGLADESLGRLLHLEEHHGGDLLRREGLRLRLGELNPDVGLAVLGDDVEGPELHVVLHSRVRKSAADEALGVVDGVGRVERSLVLGGVADEALAVREGDVRGSHTVALIIGDDLDLAVLVHADARVSCAKVNAHNGIDLLSLFLCARRQEAERENNERLALHIFLRALD